tara:strand:- start:366 stop:614 length:249 start_codon:yes stop_codon:yes gene_type:complete
MGQDTVLISAFYFSAIGGAIWLILKQLQASSLQGRVKRLLTYVLLGLVVATAIYVTYWLSQNNKSNLTGKSKVPRTTNTRIA